MNNKTPMIVGVFFYPPHHNEHRKSFALFTNARLVREFIDAARLSDIVSCEMRSQTYVLQ